MVVNCLGPQAPISPAPMKARITNRKILLMGDLRYTLTGGTITVNGTKNGEVKAIRAVNEVVRYHYD
jgi:hypothetical protein